MKVVIAGAGAVGSFLAGDLASNGHDVLVIDRSPAAISRVRALTSVAGVVADACEVDVLQEARLEEADVVIAATGDDEDNLVISLLAKQEFAVPRVIARVNHPKNHWLFDDSWGVDVAVSTPHLISALVEEAVSVGSIVNLLQFEGGHARLIEVTLAEASPAARMTIEAIGLPREAAVVALLRDGHLVVPRSDTQLAAGDEVVLLVTGDAEMDVRKLLVANVSDAAVEGAEVDAPRRQAAFLDLDKTVICKASMAAFRGPLYEGGLLTKRGLIRALFAQLVYLHLGANDLRLARMREVLLKVTRGWDRDKVSEIVDETLEVIVEPIIYAEAMDLIEQHRVEGHLVVIVSASPAEIVEPLGRHLGVDEAIASRAEVDEEGRYTGAMAFYAYGPYKAEAIEEFALHNDVDLAESYAYSDSYTDLPMLDCVGHPVAVNPDRVLLNIAKDRGWEVRNFVRPVRLRDRVRDRVPFANSRPALALSASAAVLGAGVATVGWWLGIKHGRRAGKR